MVRAIPLAVALATESLAFPGLIDSPRDPAHPQTRSGKLTGRQVARPVLRQDGLLRLDPDLQDAHCRSRDRPADRGGIRRRPRPIAINFRARHGHRHRVRSREGTSPSSPWRLSTVLETDPSAESARLCSCVENLPMGSPLTKSGHQAFGLSTSPAAPRKSTIGSITAGFGKAGWCHAPGLRRPWSRAGARERSA